MKRVYTSGNMPQHVAVFAKQLSGQLIGMKETEFWEASSIDEFEKNAFEIGYEIIPTEDMSTGRSYLVGFDVTDSEIVSANNTSYAQLKMYFIEITSQELRAWTKKIKEHRNMQQEDYFLRKERKTKGKK
jgi:hypothetical protein